MKVLTSRPAIAFACAAVLSMTATPAFADGWHRQSRHHDGIDAGDLFAGLLVIGGIAAIAAAASNADKERRDERDSRYPDSRYPDDDYRDPDYRAPSPRYGEYPERYEDRGADRTSSSHIGEAADRCVDEIERGPHRVDSVDSVWRDGDGWRVDGRVDDGRDFSCTVGGDGRIRKAAVAGQAR